MSDLQAHVLHRCNTWNQEAGFACLVLSRLCDLRQISDLASRGLALSRLCDLKHPFAHDYLKAQFYTNIPNASSATRVKKCKDLSCPGCVHMNFSDEETYKHTQIGKHTRAYKSALCRDNCNKKQTCEHAMHSSRHHSYAALYAHERSRRAKKMRTSYKHGTTLR